MSSNAAAKNPTKRNRNVNPELIAAERPVVTDGGFDTPHIDPAIVRGLFNSLGWLCQRDDGWLRIVPPHDGTTLYLKWKFTRGEHAGRYVMAVVNTWEFPEGIQLLMDKLDDVAAGMLRPCKDTPYGQ